MKKALTIISLVISFSCMAQKYKPMPNIKKQPIDTFYRDTSRHFSFAETDSNYHWSIDTTLGKYVAVFGRTTSMFWILRSDFGADGGTIYLQTWPDTVLTISGDTMQAIRNLISYVNKKDSIIKVYKDFVEISSDFTNRLPDKYRDEKLYCPWRKYYDQLKKFGYKTTNLKEPLTPCK